MKSDTTPKHKAQRKRFIFATEKVKIKGFTQSKGLSCFTYFFRDESEIYTRTHAHGHTPKSFHYKHENCLRNYKTLLDSPIEIDDHYQTEGERLDFIWKWLWRLSNENKYQFFEIVADLLLYPNEQVAQRSAYNLLKKGYRDEIITYFASTFGGNEGYKRLILSKLLKIKSN